jgi:putative hydrolase of the HAD superfamily
MIDGVEDVLKELKGRYRLVMATKGDLLDQERKLKKSGLEHYFHHIEIMSDKREEDFRKLIRHLDIHAEYWGTCHPCSVSYDVGA